MQRRHRHDRRRDGDVGGLVARHLDDPQSASAERRDRRAARRCCRRPARRARAARAVAGDRGGGALALGAGDAHDPVAVDLLSHRPRPPTTATPAAVQRRDLGPVAADARGLDHDVAAGQRRRARPRPWPAPAGPRARRPAGASSTSTGSTPSVASLARWRGPRRPRPHTPTGRPARSAQEIVGRVAHRARSGRRRGRSSASTAVGRAGRAPSRRRAPRSTGVSPAGPGRAAASATAARHSSTSPTHSNGLASPDVPSSASNAASRPASASGSRPPNTAASAARVQERGEDQVDEAALVALARTSGRAAARGRCGRPGCSCGTRRGTGRAGETLGDPALGVGTQPGEVVDRAAQRPGQHRPERGLERRRSSTTGG